MADRRQPRRSWNDLLDSLRESLHIVREAVRRTAPAPAPGSVALSTVHDAQNRALTYMIQTRRRFHGRTLRLRLRAHTSDAERAHQVLQERSPLALPPDVRPRVIVDVGAGVGMAALYYALMHPEAAVHCFEPDPAKLGLLRHNVNRHCLNVRVHERGLGHCSLARHPDGFDRPIGTLSQAMTDLGLDHIDVLHLSAGPWSVAALRGTPASVRSTAAAVVFSDGICGAPVPRSELLHLLGHTHVLEARGRAIHALIHARAAPRRVA